MEKSRRPSWYEQTCEEGLDDGLPAPNALMRDFEVRTPRWSDSSPTWSDSFSQKCFCFDDADASTDVATSAEGLSSSRQSLQSSPRVGGQSRDGSPRFEDQNYTVFRTFIHLLPSEDGQPSMLSSRSVSGPPSFFESESSDEEIEIESSSPEPVQGNDAPCFDDLEIPVVARRTFIHIPIPKFDQDDCQPVASPSRSAPTGLSQITTIRVRGLDNFWRRDDMVQLLEEKGWGGYFDFIYMPMNFRCREGGSNFGYVFVNVRDHWTASELMADLNSDSAYSFDAAPATELQGLAANVDKWKNDPVMHNSVPDECKPAMYDSQGIRISFPKHTKKLSKPRVRGHAYWEI